MQQSMCQNKFAPLSDVDPGDVDCAYDAAQERGAPVARKLPAPSRRAQGAGAAAEAGRGVRWSSLLSTAADDCGEAAPLGVRAYADLASAEQALAEAAGVGAGADGAVTASDDAVRLRDALIESAPDLLDVLACAPPGLAACADARDFVAALARFARGKV